MEEMPELAAKAPKKLSWRFHTKYMMWFQRLGGTQSHHGWLRNGICNDDVMPKWGDKHEACLQWINTACLYHQRNFAPDLNNCDVWEWHHGCHNIPKTVPKANGASQDAWSKALVPALCIAWMIRDKGRTRFYTEPMADSRPKPTLVYYCCILVPSLSARQIFIAYSMKNRQGKSGSKRHDDACRNVTEASHVVYLISWTS